MMFLLLILGAAMLAGDDAKQTSMATSSKPRLGPRGYPMAHAVVAIGRAAGPGDQTITKRCCCGPTCDTQGCTQTSCIEGLGCKVIHSWSCADEVASKKESGG